MTHGVWHKENLVKRTMQNLTAGKSANDGLAPDLSQKKTDVDLAAIFLATLKPK
jgi:hypothetical protein